jgi:hypothetical protein
VKGTHSLTEAAHQQQYICATTTTCVAYGPVGKSAWRTASSCARCAHWRAHLNPHAVQSWLPVRKHVSSAVVHACADTTRIVLDDVCTDMSIWCILWQHMGECVRNPRYMYVQCAAACDTCGAGHRVGCIVGTLQTRPCNAAIGRDRASARATRSTCCTIAVIGVRVHDDDTCWTFCIKTLYACMTTSLHVPVNGSG